MATKNYVRDVVEFKLNSCNGESTNKNRYFFALSSQAKRLNLFINKLFSSKRSRRDWVFHDLYERQRRGVGISTSLRALERNAVFRSPTNTSDLFINRGLKQQHGDKTKNECYGRPNQDIGHMSMGMANE